MEQTNHETTVNEVLADAFKKRGVGFMTLKTFLDLIKAPGRSRIGITRAKGVTQGEIKAALKPLPDAYRYSKYGSSTYLILNIPAGELLADYIREKKRKTFGQLSKEFPLKKEELIRRVNESLDAGALKAKLSPGGLMILQPSERTGRTDAASPVVDEAPPPAPTPEPAPDLSGADEETRIRAFKQAYDLVGKGSNYVFIYQIRRQLKWPRKAFDQLFDALMVDGYLAAHPGNPGGLAADQVGDSYQDDFGDLYITASWRKIV